MLNFLIRRLFYMVITLFFASIIGFLLIELPPGSYLDSEISRLRNLGGNLNQDQINNLEERYGVNDPMYVKYWKWASGAARGDFGQEKREHHAGRGQVERWQAQYPALQQAGLAQARAIAGS